MRPVFLALVLVLGSPGCSLSLGAGAAARVGGERSVAEPECNSFESCDVMYREALARAERCHEHGDSDDCESEDQDLARRYEVLHEQTEFELGALRSEAQEREAALAQAEQAAEAARFGAKTDCAQPGHPSEAAPAARHDNGWFDSGPPARR